MKTIQWTPGFEPPADQNIAVLNMPGVVYHSRPELSKHTTDPLDDCPRMFAVERGLIEGDEDDEGEEKKQTQSMIVGSLTHLLALEPKVFEESVAVMPKALKKPTKSQLGAKTKTPETAKLIEDFEAFQKENAFKDVITSKTYDQLRGMRDALMDDERSALLLNPRQGYTEMAIFWTCAITGVRVRSMLDRSWASDRIADIKTTSDASDEGTDKQVRNLTYYVQGGVYSEAWLSMQGKSLEDPETVPPVFNFIFVESKKPYCVNVRELDADYIRNGYRRWQKRLALYKQCLDSGKWPSYGGDKISKVKLPPWLDNE